MIYAYENGWRYVECVKCSLHGPGECSIEQAAASWNDKYAGRGSALKRGRLPDDFVERATRRCSGKTESPQTISEWVKSCHEASKSAGWHDTPREKGTLLMLIVSEISEAMEGERKGLMDDKLPNRPMAEVELADAMIRICDYAGAYGYDLEGAMREKMAYNAQREDHKREVRDLAGGKKW
jgi:NTP pyrophosphatase (non-canonical NTP hydrolase)